MPPSVCVTRSAWPAGGRSSHYPGFADEAGEGQYLIQAPLGPSVEVVSAPAACPQPSCHLVWLRRTELELERGRWLKPLGLQLGRGEGEVEQAGGRGGQGPECTPNLSTNSSPPSRPGFCLLQLCGKAVALVSVRRCPTDPSLAVVARGAMALSGDPPDKAISP